jgi:iron complex outermembrane receptor protein/outer membrane receptor for ferrienterochelin and colicins
MLHPRMFLYPSKGAQIIVGYSGIWDKRIGGDMQVIDKKEGPGHQFFEENNSVRHTGELIYDQQLKGKAKLTLKGSYSHFNLKTSTNTYATDGLQKNYYSELSILKSFGESSLVAGINANGDMFETLAPDTAALQSVKNHYLGAFAQFSWHVTERTILETGLRTDHHNTYGWFTLPRVAVFHRLNNHWATRAGFGMGYKAPNPLSKTIVEFTLLQLQPLTPAVKAERSYGFNAEVNYKYEWGDENTLFVNQAFFLTQISNPVLFSEKADNKVILENAGGPVVTSGSDTYIQMEMAGWELYLGYTFTNALRKYLSANQFMPLTPKHRLATVIAKEFSDRWFAGIEASYNGTQKRLDNSNTPGYLFAAAMMRYSFNKHWSVVINCENLLDFRQSKKEQLFTGSLLNPQFEPLWAPIDGRIANISVRWKL